MGLAQPVAIYRTNIRLLSVSLSYFLGLAADKSKIDVHGKDTGRVREGRVGVQMVRNKLRHNSDHGSSNVHVFIRPIQAVGGIDAPFRMIVRL